MRMTAHLGAACAAFLALAAPAAASELLVVDGDRVRKVEDPYLPALDLPPAPGMPKADPRAGTAAGPSVRRALLSLYRAERITRDEYDGYKALYLEARSVRRRLSGARRNELARVIANLENIAGDRRLTAGRVKPLFLILQRNTEWWRARAFPASGARVTFGEDPVIFQYYRGEGLQIQPLANFGKANALYNACVTENPRPDTRCREGALRELLDRLVQLASRRGDFTTWEYYFRFGGGSPPWTSGLSQGTAIQALARGAQLLEQPSYAAVAADALGAFERRAPTGVRLPVDEGNHYLIYSFDRRLLVLNGFLQSVIGLHDYFTLTGDPRAQPLLAAGEAAARAAVPRYDTGAWSLYALRGRESDLGYHRLVRDFLQGLCSRTAVPVYCTTADGFTRYLLEHPKLDILRPSPRRVRIRKPVRLRFRLSKVSRVEIQVTRGGRMAFRRRVINLGHGVRSFTWVPRAPGRYRIRIEAADLRNHHTVKTRSITVRRR
ncbi:MAG: D-glucuronyl C5-epimerase family protein [Thermoleophilaceae bacterium]